MAALFFSVVMSANSISFVAARDKLFNQNILTAPEIKL